MSAPATDVANGLKGREVVCTKHARDLALRLGGHCEIEDRARFGISFQVSVESAGKDFLRGYLASAHAFLQCSLSIPEGPKSEHSREGTHGVRMIGAQQAGSRRMREQITLRFKNAMGGQETQHAAECIGISMKLLSQI